MSPPEKEGSCPGPFVMLYQQKEKGEKKFASRPLPSAWSPPPAPSTRHHHLQAEGNGFGTVCYYKVRMITKLPYLDYVFIPFQVCYSHGRG